VQGSNYGDDIFPDHGPPRLVGQPLLPIVPGKDNIIKIGISEENKRKSG
jgi:hypothetical protein